MDTVSIVLIVIIIFLFFIFCGSTKKVFNKILDQIMRIKKNNKKQEQQELIDDKIVKLNINKQESNVDILTNNENKEIKNDEEEYDIKYSNNDIMKINLLRFLNNYHNVYCVFKSENYFPVITHNYKLMMMKVLMLHLQLNWTLSFYLTSNLFSMSVCIVIMIIGYFIIMIINYLVHQIVTYSASIYHHINHNLQHTSYNHTNNNSLSYNHHNYSQKNLLQQTSSQKYLVNQLQSQQSIQSQQIQKKQQNQLQQFEEDNRLENSAFIGNQVNKIQEKQNQDENESSLQEMGRFQQSKLNSQMQSNNLSLNELSIKEEKNQNIQDNQQQQQQDQQYQQNEEYENLWMVLNRDRLQQHCIQLLFIIQCMLLLSNLYSLSISQDDINQISILSTLLSLLLDYALLRLFSIPCLSLFSYFYLLSHPDALYSLIQLMDKQNYPFLEKVKKIKLSKNNQNLNQLQVEVEDENENDLDNQNDQNKLLKQSAFKSQNLNNNLNYSSEINKDDINGILPNNINKEKGEVDIDNEIKKSINSFEKSENGCLKSLKDTEKIKVQQNTNGSKQIKLTESNILVLPNYNSRGRNNTMNFSIDKFIYTSPSKSQISLNNNQFNFMTNNDKLSIDHNHYDQSHHNDDSQLDQLNRILTVGDSNNKNNQKNKDNNPNNPNNSDDNNDYNNNSNNKNKNKFNSNNKNNTNFKNSQLGDSELYKANQNNRKNPNYHINKYKNLDNENIQDQDSLNKNQISKQKYNNNKNIINKNNNNNNNNSNTKDISRSNFKSGFNKTKMDIDQKINDNQKLKLIETYNKKKSQKKKTNKQEDENSKKKMDKLSSIYGTSMRRKDTSQSQTKKYSTIKSNQFTLDRDEIVYDYDQFLNNNDNQTNSKTNTQQTFTDTNKKHRKIKKVVKNILPLFNAQSPYLEYLPNMINEESKIYSPDKKKLNVSQQKNIQNEKFNEIQNTYLQVSQNPNFSISKVNISNLNRTKLIQNNITKFDHNMHKDSEQSQIRNNIQLINYLSSDNNINNTNNNNNTNFLKDLKISVKNHI